MTGVDRLGSTQQPPPAGADLTAFPAVRVRAGSRWFREHGAAGAWYFASGPGGRFTLDPPDGTLYLANSAAAAARERVGPDLMQRGVIPASIVADRWVSTLRLPHGVLAADTTHEDAVTAFRVGPELATMRPYDTPRRWAAALFAAGFGGIRALLRHSGPRGRALAVFGPGGARDWAPDPAPVPLRDVLARLPGAVVVGPMADADVPIVPPPS